MDTYEKKYKALLEQARDYHSRCQTEEAKRELEAIFPELREGEDERIRKFLITIVNNLSAPNFKEAERKDVLAWLEKQKEATCVAEIIDRLTETEQELLFNELDMQREQKPADDNPLDDPRFTEGFDAGRSVQKIFDEPKPAWSEEDEMIRKAILGFLNPDKGGTKYSSCAELVKWSDWLKSLHPQPKQEWSEEDELTIADLINYFEGDSLECSAEEMVQRIKSLRPQPHTVSIKDATKFGNLEYERGVKDGIQSEKSRQWKPSEEDIKMLEHIIGQYETGNKNSKVMGYLPRIEELNFLKEVLSKWKN